jgi:tetratricopeptide (TPR) repeat protein
MGGDSLAHYAIVGAWARETGKSALARALFDSALAAARAPGYAVTGRAIYATVVGGQRAIALAGLGRATEAREAIEYADSVERAIALPNEPNLAAGQDFLAYAELVLGNRDAALARLERLLALPSGRTAAMVRVMWPYTSLHGDPQFKRLVELPP